VQTALLGTSLQMEGARVVRVDPDAAFSGPLAKLSEGLRLSTLRSVLARALGTPAAVVQVESAPRRDAAGIAAVGLETARRFGARAVLRVSGPELDDVSESLPLADAVVVPSPHLRDLVRDRFGVEAVFLPRLVEDGGFDAPAPRRSGPLRLLAACPLDGRHGATDLLAAAAEAFAGGVDLEFVVAGDGPERRALERPLIPSLRGRVTFAGDIDREALLQILRATDVALDASPAVEPSALVADALAAGVPAVVVDHPGTAWMVDHEETGLVTRTGDRGAMAGAVAALAADRPRLIQLGWCAKIRAVRWNWGAARDGWAAAYGLLVRA
jgi:glycosyltransferase involved in cell wall biosynthesis